MTQSERQNAYMTQNPELCLKSPMDRMVYNAMKTAGICPVMQYPLGEYWIDFAFPVHKVSIEHNRQPSDKQRTKEMLSQGWKIYRLNDYHFKFYFDENGEEKMRVEDLFEFLRKQFKKNKEEEFDAEIEMEKYYQR